MAYRELVDMGVAEYKEMMAKGCEGINVKDDGDTLTLTDISSKSEIPLTRRNAWLLLKILNKFVCEGD